MAHHDQDAVAAGEHERLLSWRELRFLTLGLPPLLALELARSAVDLHDFERLTRAGCPPETAASILR